MKRILFLICLMIGQFAYAQTGVEFKETAHKFGKIKKGVPVSFVFEYKNVTAKPIVIEFANADCGCTTPEYKQEALPKGQKATIKVTYNAAVEGVFKKSVNVKFTHSNQPYILTLEGEVAADTKSAKAKS